MIGTHTFRRDYIRKLGLNIGYNVQIPSILSTSTDSGLNLIARAFHQYLLNEVSPSSNELLKKMSTKLG